MSSGALERAWGKACEGTARTGECRVADGGAGQLTGRAVEGFGDRRFGEGGFQSVGVGEGLFVAPGDEPEGLGLIERAHSAELHDMAPESWRKGARKLVCVALCGTLDGEPQNLKKRGGAQQPCTSSESRAY